MRNFQQLYTLNIEKFDRLLLVRKNNYTQLFYQSYFLLIKKT